MKCLLSFVCVFGATIFLVNAKREVHIQRAVDLLQHVSDNMENMSVKEHRLIINAIADAIIKEVRYVLKKPNLDPINIPDVRENFQYTLLFNYYGELKLSKGTLRDAHTLYRGGNVTISRVGDVATIEVPLNFKDFVINYNYQATFMDFGPSGTLEGIVNDVRVFCVLSIDTVKRHLSLEEFKVLSMGKPQINFDGNTGLDWLLNIIGKITVMSMKSQINKVVETTVADQLRIIIEKINKAWDPR